MGVPLLLSILSALVALIVLIVILFFSLKLTKIWFNPVSLFSLAWIFLICLPLLVVIDEPFNPAGILYIAAFTVCFTCSVVFFPWGLAIRRNKKKLLMVESIAVGRMAGVFLICVLLGLLFNIFDLIAQGIAFSSDILAIAGEYTARRYALSLNENVFSKLALLAAFQSAVFGGLVFGFIRSVRWKVVVMAVALSPSLFVMIFQSAKGLAFLSAALMIGAWMVTRLFQNDYRAPQIRLGYALGAVSLVFVAVIISFMARFGNDMDIIRYYLASYSSGHLYAFLDWFSDRYFSFSRVSGYDQPELQAGFFTFMGLFKALGDVREVPLGIYDEFYEIPGLLITNIYTVFRGLIADFGLVGSLFVGFFAGFLANTAFFIMLWNRFSAVAIVVFIYGVGIIYQSYVVSSLTWISIPASAVISMLLLLPLKKRLRFNSNSGRYLVKAKASI